MKWHRGGVINNPRRRTRRSGNVTYTKKKNILYRQYARNVAVFKPPPPPVNLSEKPHSHNEQQRKRRSFRYHPA